MADSDEDFMDLLGPELQRLRSPAPVIFGSDALASREFQLPAAEALAHSVERPLAKTAHTPLTVQRITANKIRLNFMNLLQRNEENAQVWLEQVAANNPKVALELLIDIAQFITPKLRAVAMQFKDDTDPLRAAQANALRGKTIEELQAMVVSDQ